MAERLTEERVALIAKCYKGTLVDELITDRAALVKRVKELEGALIRARVRLQVTLDCDNSKLCNGCCGLIENDIRAAARALAGETE